jgi:hypothetical protein
VGFVFKKGNNKEKIMNTEIQNDELFGDIYNPADLDPTLTKKGYAADAQAVGERIAQERQITTQDIGVLEAKMSRDYRVIDGVTEWINPPMKPGIEYRLTERFMGKPVYAGLFVASSASSSISLSNLETIVSYSGRMTYSYYDPYENQFLEGNVMPLPSGQYMLSISYKPYSKKLFLRMGSGPEHDDDNKTLAELAVIIKYTKTTD